MSNLNKYDFVIYGATGFTGKLVVEYAINQYNNNDEISWAIAGRNNEKLEHIQEKYNLPSEIGKFVVDSNAVAQGVVPLFAGEHVIILLVNTISLETLVNGIESEHVSSVKN